MEKDGVINEIIINKLIRNKQIFEMLLPGLEENEYRWKPSADKWCVLEVVCHLYDEEREDFRARVKHVLETPELPLAPFDPVGWVTEHKYMEQNYHEMVAKFIVAREESIVWLNSLQAPSWDNTIQHPVMGVMSARKFLVNWLAHDYHHIRQINRLNYQYLQHISSDDLNYAGNW